MSEAGAPDARRPARAQDGALTVGSKPVVSYCTVRPAPNGPAAKRVSAGQRKSSVAVLGCVRTRRHLCNRRLDYGSGQVWREHLDKRISIGAKVVIPAYAKLYGVRLEQSPCVDRPQMPVAFPLVC